jgi:Ricin-type beta-trefoil lectin domain
MKTAMSVSPALLVLLLLSGCYTPYQVASTNTNQCVHVPWDGSPILAGTRVTLAQCLGRTDNQTWTVKNGRIAGVAGMCLDVQDQAAVDGAPVIAMPCNGSAGQHWRVNHGEVTGIGGKCLDVPGGEITETAPLILATCTGSPSQRWSLR